MSSEENKLYYLIPRNVTTRFEFFPGIGWHELLILTGSIAFGGLIVLLLGILTSSPFRYILLIIIPGIAFIIIKPTPAGYSIIQTIKWWKAWSLKQKRYLYSLREDDL